uniref:TRAM domain-containing protein n=2 Tax=viral metagenome TaxID=1070528 RepID=A0A6M3MAQ5_9ZZZZ
MAENREDLALGDRITVHTVSGRGNTVISRMRDGLVALFDQNSPYFDLLAPGQSVECHVINIKENYVILNPIREPEAIEAIRATEVNVDDIVEDLEKLIENVSGNAKVVSRALLRVIRLEQVIIKILTGDA